MYLLDKLEFLHEYLYTQFNTSTKFNLVINNSLALNNN